MAAGNAHDEWEPIWGLPEELPPGEEILWQGQPEFWSLARRAYHLIGLSVYFLIVVGWLALNASTSAGLSSVTLAGSLALIALALFATLAWYACKTTVYTITNRRVVMRIGIALSINLNLPFKQIVSAQLKSYRDGTGDIPLKLSGEQRIAYLLLWPHARPWHVRTPQPALRSVPRAEEVAQLLSSALRASLGQDEEQDSSGLPEAAGPAPVGTATDGLLPSHQ
jgi:hypothetical protein